MSLHVVADQPDRISALRKLLEPRYRVTSSLLHEENGIPKGCDAAIVSTDLKNADNIAALKEVSARFKGAKRIIYIIDQRARLFAAQAYALGATHVLFNPVTAQSLLRALADRSTPNRHPEDTQDKDHGTHGAASSGAASLASMFTAIQRGQAIDIADAKLPPVQFPTASPRRVCPNG